FVQSAAVNIGVDAQGNPIGFADRADTIRFEKHGLQTGDVVVYDANGHDAIMTSSGPLESLTPDGSQTREYSAIRVDDNTLALGETFAGNAVDAGNPFGKDSGVDSARDTISFQGPHRFRTGDAVRYDSGGNPNVGGLNEDARESGIYYVRVIDDR